MNAPSPETTTTPELLPIGEVARLLGCSARHVWRLTDSDRMPRPVKLGAASRWRRAELMRWLDAGCPATQGR